MSNSQCRSRGLVDASGNVSVDACSLQYRDRSCQLTIRSEASAPKLRLAASQVAEGRAKEGLRPCARSQSQGERASVAELDHNNSGQDGSVNGTPNQSRLLPGFTTSEPRFFVRAAARHRGGLPGPAHHQLNAPTDREMVCGKIEDLRQLRVPEDRDHQFQAIVITHSRAS